jgi:uncharacterized protein YfaT (DUF1175 family)
MCHPPAMIVAGYRSLSLCVCLRWLPVWLPESGNPVVIGLHIYGFVASAAAAGRKV